MSALPSGALAAPALPRLFSASAYSMSRRRLPDWYNPVALPNRAVARALLILDRLCASRGVRLYPQWDHRLLRQVVTEGRARGHSDINMMPQCDPDCSRLGEDNAFWILGLDADGNVATTQTGRYFDLAGSLADEMKSFRLFYEHPDRHIDASCWCEMPKRADEIRGPVAHSGTIWVRRDLRGPGPAGIVLSRLLGKITRLVEVGLFAPHRLVAFGSMELYRRGVIHNYDLTEWHPGARWKLPGAPAFDGGLMTMTTESLISWAETLRPEMLLSEETRRRA